MARRKLTDKQVAKARLDYRAGRKTMQELGQELGIQSISTMWKILRGRSYKELPALVCPHCHHAIH